MRNPQNGYIGSSDGFVVLGNGNFLINDYDGGNGATVYREYYGYEATLPAGKQRGDLVDGGLTIDLSTFGLFYSDTGVALAPDGTLYFMTLTGQTVARVKIKADNSAELLTSRYIGSIDLEDIEVVPGN